MFKLLNKSPKYQETDLLPTQESFLQKYGLAMILITLVSLVAVIALWGVYYTSGKKPNFLVFFNKNDAQLNSQKQDKPPVPEAFRKYLLEPGYEVNLRNSWEINPIINTPEQAEVIVSSGFNALRIELTAVSKSLPNWEELIDQSYFEVEDTSEKEISNYTVTVTEGTDGSLYAKSGKWDNDEKVLEVRVFSASEKNTDEMFDYVAKSVIDKSLEEVQDIEETSQDDSSESTESNNLE